MRFALTDLPGPYTGNIQETTIVEELLNSGNFPDFRSEVSFSVMTCNL